jgi:hypothetical protein
MVVVERSQRLLMMQIRGFPYKKRSIGCELVFIFGKRQWRDIHDYFIVLAGKVVH